MANFLFNVAKGRAVEYFHRVDQNDPANSAIVLVPCSASDTEANAQDADDLTAALATAINEQSSGGWVRKTLTDADIAAIAVDDTNNRFPATLPSVTWTGPTAGSNTTGLLVCYDPDTTSGTDANVIPIGHFDFVVTADGNDCILNSGAVALAS